MNSEVGRMLREDHRNVKQLFDQFEAARDKRKKAEIATHAMRELQIHTTLEEEIVYPVLRDADEDMYQEAQEEHHVVKMLIEELHDMSPEEENFEAKFTVLSENVKHHIKEEEGEMLPALENSDFDDEEMSQQMAARKEELMAGASTGSSSGSANSGRSSATPSRSKKSARSSVTSGSAFS